jgi:hypothetical protein
MAFQARLVPITDEAANGWTAEDGATTGLFAKIDETAPAGSEADYILSPVNPAGAIYRCKLSGPGAQRAGKGTLSIRWKIEGAISTIVRLFEGALERARWGGPRTNLLPFSQELETWAQSNVTTTANDQTAPDGTLTADRISNGVLTAYHYISRNPPDYLTTRTYTLSVYAKAGTCSWLKLYVSANNPFWANFNLSGGGAVGKNSIAPAIPLATSIQPLANGWYRCSITLVPANLVVSPSVLLLLESGDNNLGSYIGTNIDLWLWGAQLENNSVATAYIPTQGSPVTVPASSGALEIAIDNAVTGSGIIWAFGQGPYDRGQSFRPSSSFDLSAITLGLRKAGTPTDNVVVKVYSDQGITLLGSSDILPMSTIGTTMADYTLNFATPIPLTGGTTYYFVPARTGAINNTHYPELQSTPPATYTDGTLFAIYSGDGSWTAINSNAYFRIWKPGIVDGWQTLTQELNGAELASIADFNNLFVEVEASV